MKKISKSTISDFILGIVLMLLALFAFLLSWAPWKHSKTAFTT
jgi:CHASE3 domain sensor protein